MHAAVERGMRGVSVAARGIATSSRALEKGFLSSFFERKVEVQHGAHSDKLAEKERISEISTHNVR